MDHSESNVNDSNKCRDKIDSPIEVTGFTLLEVLLTFLVLGLVLAQIAPKYNTSVQFSRDQAQLANYIKIEGAVELNRVDTGTLPTRLEDLLTAPPGKSNWRGPYLDKIPNQPNGHPYTIDAQGKVGI